MIELVFAVCMMDDPSNCKTVRLNFDAETVSAQQCLMKGQAAMARWSMENDGWQAKDWRCGVAGRVAGK